MLTATRLRELLRYDKGTGQFTRLVTVSNAMAGTVAGSLHKHGYIHIKIDGASYKAHRLAWLYVTGEWPTPGVDHKDTDRSNNRWGNIRVATKKQNGANRGPNSNNKIGLKGVSKHSQTPKWRSVLKSDGKQKYLGLFDCPAAAHFAYVVAANKEFGQFARAA